MPDAPSDSARSPGLPPLAAAGRAAAQSRPWRNPPRWLRRGPGWLLHGLLLALFAWAAALLLDWALLEAVFRPDAAACRALQGNGACWGVIAEKGRAILFGRYPYGEHWRSLVASLLLLALLLGSGWRALRPAAGRPLALAWLLGLGACLALLYGGFAGLSRVDTARWGGLPLTLLLTLLGLGGALPLAVGLALARQSAHPWRRRLATAYIELVRGVPLVPVLFLATFLLPLLLPQGWTLDVLLRVLLGLVLFAAAFLAEILRGGLQALPAGQREAAAALGLTPWQQQRHVVLPQVFRSTLPALMNSCISTLKETSLVTIVGLHELTGSLALALAGDPDWRLFYLEGYLFLALLYGSSCHALSRYSRFLERRLATRG